MITKAAMCFLFLMTSVSAFADSIGTVDFVEGEALQIVGAKKVKVNSGATFSEGDLFDLEKDAKVILKFQNGNSITLKSKTKFKIKSYPGKSEKKASAFELIYGTVRALVTKKSKNVDFQIMTPSSVTGVRGTDFLVSYDPKLKEARCITFEGVVEFANVDARGKVGKRIRLSDGQISSVIERSEPRKVKRLPEGQLKKIKRGVSFDRPTKKSGEARSGRPGVKDNEGGKDSSDPGKGKLRGGGAKMMKDGSVGQRQRMRSNSEGMREIEKKKKLKKKLNNLKKKPPESPHIDPPHPPPPGGGPPPPPPGG